MHDFVSVTEVKAFARRNYKLVTINYYAHCAKVSIYICKFWKAGLILKPVNISIFDSKIFNVIIGDL
jgi:hypothetical protein